jgi:hypothetical protein
MTSRKLSESDKKEILQLYWQPGETTSTLAGRYGVSNSTINRILKSGFSEAEYDTLLQKKRNNRASSEMPSLLDLDSDFSLGAATTDSEGMDSTALDSETLINATKEQHDVEAALATETNAAEISTSKQQALPITAPLEEAAPSSLTANGRRLRKRSSAPSTPILSTTPTPSTPIAPPTVKVKTLDLDRSPIAASDDAASTFDEASEVYDEPAYEALLTVDSAEEIMGEALLSDEADLDDDLDDDDELDDDDLEDDELDDDLDDDLDNGALLVGGRIAGKALVQVLPLAEASLPRTCYLVVDRSAELIARPLKEFGDLGQIPEAEVLSKTLPIFDNHRVAKRYSNPRTQRVIKLPDAQVLQKTSSHLQAKGITRLLIDGQVYAL